MKYKKRARLRKNTYLSVWSSENDVAYIDGDAWSVSKTRLAPDKVFFYVFQSLFSALSLFLKLMKRKNIALPWTAASHREAAKVELWNINVTSVRALFFLFFFFFFRFFNIFSSSLGLDTSLSHLIMRRTKTFGKGFKFHFHHWQ